MSDNQEADMYSSALTRVQDKHDELLKEYISLKAQLKMAMNFTDHYDFCTISKDGVCVCGYLDFKETVKARTNEKGVSE